MNEQLLTTTDVAERLGVPPHRVIYLCEKGVVAPQEDPPGRGHVRRFSRDDLLTAAIALELQEWGFKTDLMLGLQPLLRKCRRVVKPESGSSLYSALLKAVSQPVESSPLLRIAGSGRMEWLTGVSAQSAWSSSSSVALPKARGSSSWVIVDLAEVARSIAGRA